MWMNTAIGYLQKAEGHQIRKVPLTDLKPDADWPEDDGAALGLEDLDALIACNEAGQPLFDYTERLGVPYVRFLGENDHSLMTAPLYEWPDIIVASNRAAVPACLAEVPLVSPPVATQHLQEL